MFRQTFTQTFFIVAKFCGNRAWTEAAAAANGAANDAFDAVAAIVAVAAAVVTAAGLLWPISEIASVNRKACNC